MQFDLVYKELGEFGLFSKYIVYVSTLTSTYAGFLFVNSFFVLGIPDHRLGLLLKYFNYVRLMNDNATLRHNYLK